MKKLWLFALTLACLSACNTVPEGVIDTDKMAELMADIHQANAVVELNPNTYTSDSVKMSLKKAVFERYGITEEQFDSSLMWYGHNLDIYKDVYDNVIKILEKREHDVIAEARLAGEKMTIMGDSIDIWTLSRRIILDKKQFGKYAQLQFSTPADENARKGDRYEWHLYPYNGKMSIDALLGVDYNDGSSEYQVSNLRMDEHSSIMLQADSNKIVSRVYGYMLYEFENESAVFVDSLMLYRSRLNSSIYNRHNRQRTIGTK